MKFINGIRYKLIELLAQDMPVVLNVNISRPEGFSGKLIDLPRADLPGMFQGLMLLNSERPAIISPTRDVKEPVNDH